jgi:hypothetical protein
VSNHLKPSSRSARVTERHGRKGDVPLSTSVPPALKDDLVAHCLEKNRTQRDTIVAALWLLLSLDDAEMDRWYGG